MIDLITTVCERGELIKKNQYFSRGQSCNLIVGFVLKACRCEVCGTYLWLDSSIVCWLQWTSKKGTPENVWWLWWKRRGEGTVTIGETQNQNCTVMLMLLSCYTDIVYLHNLFPFRFWCTIGVLISTNQKTWNGQLQKISIPNHRQLPCFNPPLPSKIPKCITPLCPENSIIMNPPSPSEFLLFFWKYIFDLATALWTNEHEFMPPQGCDLAAQGHKLYSSVTRKTYR